ncbi:MFS transporter [Plantactinospora sp. B5E13]|uniref:MFS transporter n=1 Tax=Plantactinospora sp. B5E13 TaxID=3153758 RepID=UPI00325EE118
MTSVRPEPDLAAATAEPAQAADVTACDAAPPDSAVPPDAAGPAAGPPSRRMFLRYLGGFGFSLLGDQLWFMALAWAAVRLDDPTQTSLVMTIGAVPRAALLLVGGTLADRWGALRVAQASQLLRLLVMAAAAGTALAVGPDLVVLAIVALVFGAIDAVHLPAVAALPPQLLARDQLPAGQGLVQTLERAATIVGAPLGGFLVAFGGFSLTTAINVGLFGLAFLVLRTLRLTMASSVPTKDDPGAARPEGTWRSLWAGLRYVARDPVLGPILLVVSLLNLMLTAPLNVGVALLAQTRGWDASGFSGIIAGFGAGATLGALSMLRWRPRRRPAVIGLLWVALGSGCLAAITLSPNLPTAIGAAAALGFSAGPASALLLGLVQARTQTNYLGRVMSLVTFSALGLVPVGYSAFGLLVEATSLTATFLGCGAVGLLTALAALTLPTLRDADFAEPAPGTP